MTFNLYRLSYHPEYSNVRMEYIFSVDGYRDNIYDIVQAENYFKVFLFNSLIKVVTPIAKNGQTDHLTPD